jgi:signal transduction histidine kinase
MKKRNLKVSFYLVFAGLGLLISFGVCTLMFFQFRSHIKQTYFETLSNVATMVAKQYPFLSDTAALEHAVKHDENWFWDFHQKMVDIVDSFDLAYIYFFNKSKDGTYVTIMDSSFPRNDNRLGQAVWPATPTPDGVDEAWTSQKMTYSPRPSDEGEWGVLVSAYMPILHKDETVGILGVDYNIAYVRSMEFSVLFFLIISFIASVALVALLAIFGSRTVMMPVKEAQEHNRKIEALMKALKAAFESRNAFMNSITNEMTDPINVIIQSSGELLEDEKIPEAEHKSLEIINDSGIVLFNAINDILDLSKIESGKMDFHYTEYELPNLINEITYLFYMTHNDNKNVHFDIQLEDDLPLKLTGDELNIRKICHRILTNAFKYTHEGTIAFKMSCKREKGYVWLNITISDTGVGMTKKDLDTHLADYGKIDVTNKLKTVGTTGLGLYITKRLLEAMKGKLVANSEKGKGSVFTMYLPQKLSHEENISADTLEKLKKFEYTKSGSRINTIKKAEEPVPPEPVMAEEPAPPPEPPEPEKAEEKADESAENGV